MTDLITSEHPASTSPAQERTRGGAFAGWDSLGLTRLAWVLGLFLAVALLYWPSALALNAKWASRNATSQDGYLVLLISLWLFVRERKRLAVTPVRPMPGALALLAALSVLWLWAWRAAIQEAHVELLPLLLVTAVVAALGWRTARVVAFPIGYLYFAMPLWGHINGLLQGLSALMTGLLVWITALPAYMQGNFIVLPWGEIQIAGGCSGLNTFVVGLALGALYGKLTGARRRRRLILLGVMGLLALIVNWVRIFIVTAVAYETHMRSPLVRHHIWFGWLLFALTFAAFLWWAERSRAPNSRAPSAEPAPHETPASFKPRVTGAAMFSLTIGALAVLPLLSYGMDLARGSGAQPVRISWPAGAPGWNGPRLAHSDTWVPKFVNASGESFAQYTYAGRKVQAYAVAYRVQTQTGKLLGYWNSLLGDPKRLRALSRRLVSSPSGRWHETSAIDPAGQRSLIWYRYRIGQRHFVNARLAQIWYGLEALARPPLSSLIALRARCVPDCRAADALLDAAAPRVHPTLR